MQGGALVTYNNATEPFGHRALAALLPRSWTARIHLRLGALARDYYRRTVEGFLDVATRLDLSERERDVAAMRALLSAGSVTERSESPRPGAIGPSGCSGLPRR